MLIRAQAVIPYFTGIPTDVVTNQFHVNYTGGTFEAGVFAIHPMLQTFYTALYPTTNTARANYVDWLGATIKYFNLADPTPRVPIIENMGYVTAGTATSTVPTEVATVLSWHAAPESGVAYQRLYNRIFLGLLLPGYFNNSAAGAFPTFGTTWINSVRNAAIGLHGDLNDPATTGQWMQVSSAGGVTIARPVAGGWVDNSPDTQRRRSVLPSSRNVWTP